MPAMIMDHPVGNRTIFFKRLAPGDEIKATVFVGDPTLHDMRVTGHVPPAN
jgi:hypothetical protein